MESNTFFLQRAVARGAEWHVSYPALCMASATETVGERHKQIVVATADDSHIRLVVFSSLGAILDFHASWNEFDDATRGWLAFTIRWNRWWVPDVAALAEIERHAYAPTDVRIANGIAKFAPADTGALRGYLNAIEEHYRRDEAISRILFPIEGTFARQSRAHAP